VTAASSRPRHAGDLKDRIVRVRDHAPVVGEKHTDDVRIEQASES
jgi:hypothetical protein